jgi:preprotein translocase SecE subunit
VETIVAKKAAKKPAKAPSTSSDETKVTRIVASDAGTAKRKKTPATKEKAAEKGEKAPKKESRQRKNPISAFFGYFAGAWRELRLVRWPDRRATWGMTGALIGFTLFFVVVILLLDALFQYLFTLAIK